MIILDILYITDWKPPEGNSKAGAFKNASVHPYF